MSAYEVWSNQATAIVVGPAVLTSERESLSQKGFVFVKAFPYNALDVVGMVGRKVRANPSVLAWVSARDLQQKLVGQVTGAPRGKVSLWGKFGSLFSKKKTEAPS